MTVTVGYLLAPSKPSGGGVTTLSQALTPQPRPPAADPSLAIWNTYRASHPNGGAASSPNQPHPDPGGWKGFVGDVLGNSVVKAVLKPLSVLDIPRRVIISAVKEGSDLFRDGQSASFGDFASQVQDQSFGFGRLGIHTGNKWVDRAIGLVGDVALDPLTYVGLHGLHEFAGQAGRFNLARLVADSAKVGVHSEAELARIGGLAAEAAKMGRAALTAEDVSRLGLERSGFYMFKTRLPRVRIPGTGALADMTEGSLAKLRLAASDSKLVEAFKRGFTPNDYRDLRVDLAAGKVATTEQNLAIRIVTSRDVERAAAAQYHTEGQLAVRGAIEQHGKAELASFRGTAYKVIEGGVASSPAEQTFADSYKALLDGWGGKVEDAYAAIDPTSSIKMRGGYFPHMLTDNATEYVMSGKPYAKELAATFNNPVGAESIFNPRVLQKDSTFFGVKLTAADANSTEALNKIAEAAGFKGEFFKTDLIDVLDSYTAQYGAQMGTVARLADINEHGLLDAVMMKDSVLNVVDPQNVADAKNVMVKADNARKAALTNVKDSLSKAAGGVRDMRAGAATTLGDLTKVSESAAVKAAKSESVLNGARAHLSDAVTAAEEAKARLQSIFMGGEVPAPAQAMVAQWEGVVQELYALEPKLVAAHAAAAAALQARTGAFDAVVGAADVAAEDAAKVLEAEVARVGDKATALAAKQQDPLNYNILIGDNWDAIVNGGELKFPTDLKSVKQHRANLESMQKVASGDASKQSMSHATAKVGVSGNADAFITVQSKTAPWWHRVETNGKVSADAVQSFSRTDHFNAIGTAIQMGEHDVVDGLTSALWLRSDAERFFGGNLPEHVGLLHEELTVAGQNLDSSLSSAQREIAAAADVAAQSRGMGVNAADVSSLNATGSQQAAIRGSAPHIADQITVFAERHVQLSAARKRLDQLIATSGDQGLVDEAVMGDMAKILGYDPAAAAANGAASHSVFEMSTTPSAEAASAAFVGKTEAERAQAGLGGAVTKSGGSPAEAEAAMAWAQATETANQMPTGTLAELKAKMTYLQAAIEKRRWPTGGEVFTYQAGLKKFGEKTTRAQQWAGAVTAIEHAGYESTGVRLDRAAANLTHAMKQTEAAVQTELYKRFRMLSNQQFTFGGGILTHDATSQLAVKIAREYRPVWAAAAAADGAAPEAVTMLKHLDSIINDGLSSEQYAALLVDHASKFMEQIPEGELRAATAGLSDVARKRLDLATEAKQRLSQNPENPVFHAKALADEQTHRAMLEMAGVDLSAAQTPSGVNGFVKADGFTPVTLQNGDPLIFSRAENDALYGAGRGPFRTAAGTEYAATDIPRRIEVVDKGIADAQAKIDHATGIMERDARARVNGAVPMDPVKRAGWENVITGAQKEIGDFQKRIKVLEREAVTADPATLHSATEKMRILVHGNGSDPAWFQSGMNLNHLVIQDAQLPAARSAAIGSMWKSSPEAQHLAALDKISSDMNVIAAADAFANPGAVAAHAHDMVDAAHVADPELAAKLSTAQSAAELTHQAWKDATKAVGSMTKEQAALTAKQTALETAMDKSSQRVAQAEVRGGTREVKTATGVVSRSEPAVVKAQTQFDAVNQISVTAKTLLDVQKPALENTIAHAQTLIDAGPGLSDAVLKAGSKTMTDRQLGEVSLWVDDALHAARTLDPNDPITTVIFQATKAEGDYLLADAAHHAAVDAHVAAGKGIDTVTLVPDIEKGFSSLAAIGLPGKQMPDAAAEMLMNVKRAEMPEVAKQLNQFFGRYTKFFKAYATLSPGFHVRNAMSNTFSLFAAGAEVGNMRQGLSLYNEMMKAVKGGMAPMAWAETVVARDAELGAHAIVALRSMEAAGGGAVEEALVGFINKGHTVSDNVLTRGSRRAGGRVEGSARFMLGFDGARQGLDFQSATTRVKRFLFDYTDVGTADMAVRQVIPFWMWMSRNLPTTIVSQWANPKPFAIYNSIIRNVGSPAGPGEVVPSYIGEQGGFRVAKDWYVTPDVGFTRAAQQLAEFGDVRRMMSYINPGIRVPLEVTGGTKWYNGAPFSDKPQNAIGGNIPIAGSAVKMLAGLLGQSSTDAQGNTNVSDRFNYALMNLLPPVAQLERVVDPQSAGYQDRQGNSIAGYWGLPVKHVTQGMQDAELARLKALLAREAQAQKRNAKGVTP